MSPIHHLFAWLRQSITSRRIGASPRRRRRAVSLRLEELEHRLTPSGLNVVPEQFTTNQYTAVTLTQNQLLAGDTASGPLQLSNLTQPANATLVDNHNGTFTFTPDPTFTGSTTFQYTVGAVPTVITPADKTATENDVVHVAVSGDTAIIGFFGKTINGQTQQGAADVFVLSGNTWTQQAELTASDGTAGADFGGNVAISGDTAVISSSAGNGYVFTRVGTTWSQQAEFAPPNGNAGAMGFNGPVAIDGDTAVFTEPNQGDFFQGAAYVFVRSGSTWSQQAELTAADSAMGDLFGSSVSVSGDTIVIGADHSPNFQQPGAAYVFVRSGSTWSQQAKLTAADSTLDLFGSSVSVSGNTAVVGAPDKNAAYVFVGAGSTWSQQAELTAADSTLDSSFGGSVGISGDTAIITGSGKGYVYTRVGSTWSQQAELPPPDGTRFGGSLSVSGNMAVIGDGTQQATYAVDLDSATATATVQVNPATAQLFVSPASLPTATAGQVYSSPTFTATGGAGSGYTFQESGLLPAGITFDATGQLAGTPTQVGTFPGIVIAVSDGHGASGSQTYTLTVNHFGVNGLPLPYPQTIYAPPTPASDPNADLDAFIRGLYHSVLDRDVESASSLTYWENIFSTVQSNPQLLGVMAGTDPYLYVAQGFWNSQEHRQDEVMTYYHDFLGRTLDLSNPFDMNGLTYWTNHFLLLGWQEADVTRGFLASPEYLYDHRADASLANALNTNLLSGVATTADLQTWTSALKALDAQRAAIQNQTFATPEDYQAQLSADRGALDDETAKTGVLFDMLGSSEYKQAAIQSFYLAFLRRSSTASEVQTWLAQQDASGNPLDLGTIAAMMLASAEYRTNAANSVM